MLDFWKILNYGAGRWEVKWGKGSQMDQVTIPSVAELSALGVVLTFWQ